MSHQRWARFLIQQERAMPTLQVNSSCVMVCSDLYTWMEPCESRASRSKKSPIFDAEACGTSSGNTGGVLGCRSGLRWPPVNLGGGDSKLTFFRSGMISGRSLSRCLFIKKQQKHLLKEKEFHFFFLLLPNSYSGCVAVTTRRVFAGFTVSRCSSPENVQVPCCGLW